jgi:hypothetical protein
LSWLEATKSLGLPISEEADKWVKHISTEDLKEEAIKLLGIFKEEFAPDLDDYQESDYSFVYPKTPLIESIVLDIHEGPNYKYLNNTIKDSSYFPTTYHQWTDSLWLSSFWKFVRKLKLKVVVLGQWMPALNRKNDLFFLDYIVEEGLSPKALGSLNRCRLYLQVITLADITFSSG